MPRLKRSLLTLLGLLSVLIPTSYYSLFGDLPSLDTLETNLVVPSIRITDRNGQLLYEDLADDGGRHTLVSLDSIPLALRQATIATEDANFYQNPGVDLTGILRAFWINLQGGETLAGGSTITQQVARNLLLDSDERTERTLRRKLRESYLAWQLARHYTKDQILYLYLNQMYYGGLAYGVEAAAQTYFGKPVSQLDLAESALLAGLTQAPAAYDPLTHFAAAKERQRTVLALMVKRNYLTIEESTLAAREPLRFASTPYPIEAPHFVLLVRNQLAGLVSPDLLYASGGLTVRTTLDLDWQYHAEDIVQRQLQTLRDHNAHNAAVVALDPHTGEVLALVGNADYFDDTINGAINLAVTPHQPGSALKPLVYAAAFDPAFCSQRPKRDPSLPTYSTAEAGHCPFAPATVLFDVDTTFTTHDGQLYTPLNFDRREHGPVTIRTALGSSLNVPAVITLDQFGIEPFIRFATQLGITTLGDADFYDLSLALGGGEVSLTELTAAYGSLANGGYRVTPTLILDLTTAHGDQLYTAPARTPQRVLDERAAWLVTDILADDSARSLAFGSNSVLKIDRPAAVKTGTTTDFHDNWTVGYTPDLVVGVWVGNADGSPMQNVTGLTGAAPIWHQFTRAALGNQPEHAFEPPVGLVQVEVCALSGLLPTSACQYRQRDWFIAGTAPTVSDTFYKTSRFDSTIDLAASSTPASETVLNLPPLLQPWARDQFLPLATDGTLNSQSALYLLSPQPDSRYRLSLAAPADSQSLLFQVAGDNSLATITIWIDAKPVAIRTAPDFEFFWPLQPGRHEAWVIGQLIDGRELTTDKVAFEVITK